MLLPGSEQPPSSPGAERRWPIGAEVIPGGVHFRVWAPRARKVELVVIGVEERKPAARISLTAEAGNYFAGAGSGMQDGALYGYYLNGEERLYPDPMSRFQPQGPHGPSQVVDPGSFRWTDAKWQGVELPGQVIYELHVGTFTPEGNWAAAAAQLAELANLGVTVVEVMPVADFPGSFGWGYDGVNMFAPTRLYGSPDDFRQFVDRAHALGIGVILDVVYNHLGPDGNYLTQFSNDYFHKDLGTAWGAAINFFGHNSASVREFYTTNAAYWISEFHLDGLRLDATQDIHDREDQHILADITRAVQQAAGGRSTIIVGENEPQNMRLVQPLERGGYGIDALWNDDLHHSAMVALTGRNEAYYTDYHGRPQEFISAIRHGFLYQGQYYEWQKKCRGTSTRGAAPQAFITFLQNHDQVSNSASGLRYHQVTSAGRYRALTVLLLLSPGTPMLFQGQEFAASTPFYFFADHEPELAEKVHAGRKEFMAQFLSVADPEIQARMPNPADAATFHSCQLDLTEREKHGETYYFHKELLRLRREDATFSAQRAGGVDGAVLATEAFVLRFVGADDAGGNDRLLIVNLGRDLELRPAPEPLLAPPAGQTWRLLLSSEDPRFGGGGTPPVEVDKGWRLPGHAALVLAPAPLHHTSS